MKKARRKPPFPCQIIQSRHVVPEWNRTTVLLALRQNEQVFSRLTVNGRRLPVVLQIPLHGDRYAFKLPDYQRFNALLLGIVSPNYSHTTAVGDL